MSYARTLLHEIAKEMGKEPANMNKFAELLEENMCDTQQALASTAMEELVDIGVPKLVAMKLKRRLNEPSEATKQPEEEKVEQAQLNTDKKDSPYDFLETQLRKIYDNYLTADEKLASLKVLQTIITNLLAHPEEQKYRSLKKNNSKLQQSLWRYLFMEQLFIMLGFEYDADSNSLYIPEERIDIGALIHLNDLIRDEIEDTENKPKMDPYKPGFSSTNPNFNIVEVGEMSGYENSKFQEQLDKLKSERDQLMKHHKISQNVNIYKKSGKPKLNSLITDTNEEKERKEINQVELNIFKKKIAEFQDKYMKDMKFSNARKKEFEEFLKKPLYLDSTIKIKLPNGYVIESNFSSNQRLSDVFGLLDQYLLYPDGYYLYIPPNTKQKYQKQDVTTNDKRLIDLGMVPDAVLTLMYHEPEFNKSSKLLLKQLKK